MRDAVFCVAYAVFTPSTSAPAKSDLAAGANAVSKDGSWTSKESGKGVGSQSVGRRGMADIQAGRSLLYEESRHGHSNLQALTQAQV